MKATTFCFLTLTLLLITSTTHASLVEDYDEDDVNGDYMASLSIDVQGQEGQKVGKPETGAASGTGGVVRAGNKPHETGSPSRNGASSGVGKSDNGNKGGAGPGGGSASRSAGSSCITEEYCSLKKVICFKQCFKLPSPAAAAAARKDDFVQKKYFFLPKCKFFCKKCVPTC